MLVRHRGATPTVDPTAWGASTAVLVGDVTVAAGTRVLHGAVLSTVEDEVFVASGAALFPGSRVRTGAQVRDVRAVQRELGFPARSTALDATCQCGS